MTLMAWRQRSLYYLAPLVGFSLLMGAIHCGSSGRNEAYSIEEPYAPTSGDTSLHETSRIEAEEESQRLAVLDLIRSQEEKLIECYVQGILRGGDSEGTLLIAFDLNNDGTVDRQGYETTSTIGSRVAMTCIIERMGGWSFPTREGFGLLRFTLALCRDNSTHSGCEASANPDFIRVDVTDADVPHPPSGPASLDEARNVFSSSPYAIEIYWHALSLARSSSEEAHQLLRRWLGEQRVVALLGELELDVEPFAPRQNMSSRSPFGQVFHALRDNQSEVARRTITALTADRRLVDSPAIDYLLEATVVLRPPSPQVVAFWRTHARANDGFINLTIRVLLQNRSEAALNIFAQRLRNRTIESADKISWLRLDVLQQRLHPEVLDMCLRLLRRGLPPEIRIAMLESLFDFQDQRYPPGCGPSQTRWEEASAETISSFEAIAAFARDRFALPPALAQAIETTLTTLRALPREASQEP